MRWIALAVFQWMCIVAFSQDFSNKGRDFWLGYGNHVQMFGNKSQQMSLYITSDVNTSGKVEIPGISFSVNFTIQANQISEVLIPNSAELPFEGFFNAGIHVTAEKPVVVYGHIYLSSVSGATLCLPTTTLGQEYISVNYTQVSNQANSYSYFFVVATEDNTTIEIVPSANTLGGMTANTATLKTLNKGGIYQVLSETDLTGSTIRSINNGSGCKKIAVFCGSGKIAIGCGNNTAGSSDNLYQQMYPTQTWGRKYMLVPSASRSLNYFRVVKKDPSAVVTLNGAVIPATQFFNNLYYDFSTSVTSVIESDKPILAAQYFTTQQGCNIEPNVQGDPEMIYLNPVEQTLRQVTLNSSGKYAIRNHYINVVLKNTGTAVGSFRLDGQAMAGAFQPMNGDPSYSFAQLSVGEGAHNLSCDSGFNAMAYGFGNTESYGYSAGTNLVDLYQFITIRNPYATINVPSGCKDVPFTCAITFPYKPSYIKWDFGNLFAPVNITAPTEDSSFTKDGRTLYEYRLPQSYTITQAGTYSLKVTAENPTSDGCGGEQEVNYELVVYEEPVAAFEFSATDICAGNTISVKDRTVGNGRQVVKWFWESGDGTTYSTKDISHLYQHPGTLKVRLSALTETGCITDTIEQEVVIHPVPVPEFSIVDPLCMDKSVRFRQNAAVSAGTIASWDWNWGDGNSSSVNTGVDLPYVYNQTGNYKVSLKTTSDKGCLAELKDREITIHTTPVASFLLPEICLDDAFANFRNFSYLPGNNAAPLTYTWNFATTGSPASSSDKDPRIRYSATGEHSVSLLVTSAEGCTDDSLQILTVNGSTPRSSFALSEKILCANRSLELTDQSSVDVGKITRVEIYWDYTRDITVKTLDDEPTPGKVYQHNYTAPPGNTSRKVQVRYVVYSGEQCMHEEQAEIELLPSPTFALSVPPGVCLEAPSFSVTSVAETWGLPGTGVYSGAQGLRAGSFYPGVAGTGPHTITYTYTASNGCIADTNFTVMVYPTPTVHAGGDIYVLEGGSGTLNGRGAGTGVTYQWEPVTNLTNASQPITTVAPLGNDQEYTLRAISENGCTATDKTWVYVLKTPVIPNIFSPNGDGINDSWIIQYLNTYPGCKVDVFNRYGQTVFRSVGYNQPWTGRQNGNPLPAGTYYYVIDPGNGRKTMKGSITILY